MKAKRITAELKQKILARLGIAEAPPTLSLLQGLLAAYTRTVPWESAFRIVKRAQTTRAEDCPRWPNELWHDALERGGGGTCFESNYAFFALLLALGYEGYLTINNMGDTVGCHSAIILQIDGRKWLVDVGYPLYTMLPVNPRRPTSRDTRFHRYTLLPDGPDHYQVERTMHAQPNAFTLIDRPVSESQYRGAMVRDYQSDGLFLDRVIVHKVVGGVPWRFASHERPWRLSTFVQGERSDHYLEGNVAAVISRRFGIDETTLGAALALVEERD